jgi:hypothetical protein
MKQTVIKKNGKYRQVWKLEPAEKITLVLWAVVTARIIIAIIKG